MRKSIVDNKILKSYHSVLYKLFGIITDFVTADGKIFNLCPPEHFNPLCIMIKNTECGSERCLFAQNAFEKCRETGENMVYECHVGFIEILVPLFVNKGFVGCLTAGQLLAEKPTEKSYKVFRKKTPYLKGNEKELKKLYFQTKVLSKEQLDALLELLSLIGNYIVETESRIVFLESALENDRILLARKFIENNFQNKITVSDIASAVFQSESYFSHQFKKEVGVSVIQYINRYRIDRAKDMLEQTSLNITEISFRVGFQNLTHFNRIFLKLEGKSPSAYRKSRIGKN